MNNSGVFSPVPGPGMQDSSTNVHDIKSPLRFTLCHQILARSGRVKSDRSEGLSAFLR